MATPLEGTASAAKAIARVKYSHDAMIDILITQPGIKQGELAKQFGYTEAWVSRIYNSDAFQARLAERKSELVDPTMVASIEERLKGVVTQSLDILAEKLEHTRSPDMALKVLDLGAKALGYGARGAGTQNNTQNNFVVMIPGKAASSAEWAASHAPGGASTAPVIEGGN